MSATFKLSKKKFTQHDLRKLMHQQQKKALSDASTATAGQPNSTIGVPSTKKIDSPLAKYNDLGQLMCILCKSIVRSEDVWKVHVNAKQHKENIELAKRLKEQTKNFTVPAGKRTNTQELSQSNDIPMKKLKSILKNGPEDSPATTTSSSSSASSSSYNKMNSKNNEMGEVPMDFFDDNNKSTNNFYESTMEKTSIRKDLINIQRSTPGASNAPNNDVELMDVTTDEKLPEGFFDDPIKDAKARNSEYKDPVEEEWERFQKEMKEAANFSNAIIAEDQEESTTERQIDEIDEQMRNWSRVLELDRKKHEVIEKNKVISQISNSLKYSENNTNKKETILTMQNSNNNNNNDKNDKNDDSDSDIGVGDAGSDNEFSEYLDWRCKKSHK